MHKRLAGQLYEKPASVTPRMAPQCRGKKEKLQSLGGVSGLHATLPDRIHLAGVSSTRVLPGNLLRKVVSRDLDTMGDQCLIDVTC
jgi:hypothetical protein